MVTIPSILSLSKDGRIQNPAYRPAAPPASPLLIVAVRQGTVFSGYPPFAESATISPLPGFSIGLPDFVSLFMIVRSAAYHPEPVEG